MEAKNKSFISKLTESRNFGLCLALAVLLIVAYFRTPSMYSYNAIISMLQNNAVYGLLAIGEMMIILTGGIDISIGSTLSLTGVVCCRLMAENPGVPAIVWVILSLVIGALCGALNGVLVGYFKMVPMIATLGTMYIFRGLAFLFSGGEWWFPHQFTEGYQKFATMRILNVPTILWIVLIIFVMAGIFLGYTTKGRRIYAVGTNKESAKVAGIKEAKVVFLAMVLCGMLSGLAGMLYTANYATCSYSIGESYEMTAIAICILGGVSNTGGKGRVDGVFLGFIVMAIITQFISLLPGLSVWSDAIQGAIIIAAVGLNVFTERSVAKRALKERSALI